MLSRKRSPYDLDPQKSYQMIKENKDNPNFILLDVRTESEYDGARIEGSKLLNYQSPDFTEKLQTLDKTMIYLVYCRSGRRSAKSVKIMEKMGFKEVYQILGGIQRWKRLGLPLENPGSE